MVSAIFCTTLKYTKLDIDITARLIVISVINEVMYKVYNTTRRKKKLIAFLQNCATIIMITLLQ